MITLQDPSKNDSISQPRYGDYVDVYKLAGWEGVLPIPYKAKHAPPSGTTGEKSPMPSSEQLQRWRTTNAMSNLALRLPPDIVGIDVDNYDGKAGAASLAGLEQQLGPLPVTWTSTSRRDGVSGIRLFSIPSTSTLPGQAGAGIDIVRHAHRYVMAHPSIHPQGRQYRWYTPDGVDADGGVPDPHDLPHLPHKWIDYLGQMSTRSSGAGAPVAPIAADSSEANWDPKVQEAARIWRAGVAQGTGRHDAALGPVLRLVRNQQEGRLGSAEALMTIEAEFIALITSDGTRDLDTASEEWGRIVEGAEDKASGSPRWWQSPRPDLIAMTTDEHLTDLGNARRFVALFGHDFRFVASWQAWLWWDGKRWIRDETARHHDAAKSVAQHLWAEAHLLEGDARNPAMAWARRSEDAARIQALLRLAQSDPLVATIADRFDSDPWLFNVNNGVIDLRTGQLRPHDPTLLLRRLAPVDYVPGAESTSWTSFLQDVLPSPGVRRFVQRWLGYCLTGDVSEQKLVLAFGTGANGKTTLFETVSATMGDYARQGAPDLLIRQRQDPHPTGLADLQGARLVLASESGQGRSFDETLVKRLTGGDKLKARYMRQDFFEFDPTHKIVVATNHKPDVHGTDEGIWRRMCLVPFEVSIPPENQDRSLPGRLSSELPGILAWLVEGCIAWGSEGLQVPDEITAATAEYRASQDTLEKFFDDECETGPSQSVKASVLQDRHKSWAEQAGERPLSSRIIAETLVARGMTRRRSNGIWWDGISVRPLPASM